MLAYDTKGVNSLCVKSGKCHCYDNISGDLPCNIDSNLREGRRQRRRGGRGERGEGSCESER